MGKAVSKSLIDDPHFFFAPDGKTNPKAELSATIEAIISSTEKGDNHPRCKFMARYEWLKERLNLEESLFSDITCSEWNKLIEVLQPRSAALVFPAFFMNNPASMFGHTLIRMDGTYESNLLSYATNYAAFANARDILYPFKGVFGFYKAYYSLLPYYDMVKKYNDTEQRDMWEYRLDLSQEEVRKMLMHLWELKEIYAYYYYFDENCSFNLLFLLEAAKPSLHLTDQTWLWTIPADTLKAVMQSGIVKDIQYRPARATRMQYMASLLEEDTQKMAIKIAEKGEEGDFESLDQWDDPTKVSVLDLALETIQYRYVKQEMTKADYLKHFLATLKERSQLRTPDNDPYPIPAPLPPHTGHPSGRLTFRAGKQGDTPIYEIGLRPAYHSLEDPDEGYLAGSQIGFFNTTLRYKADKGIELKNLDLIDILSLSPRDRFFTPLSFQIKTGLTRKAFPETEETLGYQINPGIGLAFFNKTIGLYYGLVETDIHMGGRFKENYIAGMGIQMGIVKQMTHSWKINLLGEELRYLWGTRFRENHVAAVQTFRVNQNNSVRLSVMRDTVGDREKSGGQLAWHYYW